MLCCPHPWACGRNAGARPPACSHSLLSYDGHNQPPDLAYGHKTATHAGGLGRCNNIHTLHGPTATRYHSPKADRRPVTCVTPLAFVRPAASSTSPLSGGLPAKSLHTPFTPDVHLSPMSTIVAKMPRMSPTSYQRVSIWSSPSPSNIPPALLCHLRKVRCRFTWSWIRFHMHNSPSPSPPSQHGPPGSESLDLTILHRCSLPHSRQPHTRNALQ